MADATVCADAHAPVNNGEQLTVTKVHENGSNNKEPKIESGEKRKCSKVDKNGKDSTSKGADEQPEDEDTERLRSDKRRRTLSPTKNKGKSNKDWEDEKRHFQRIVITFQTYRRFANGKLDKTIRYVDRLPSKHQELLQDYREHLSDLKFCIEVNQNLFRLIVQEESRLFENQNEVYPQGKNSSGLPEPTVFDYEKLQAVLKHIVRDWSSDGEKERDSCYAPIIEEVERQYSHLKRKVDVRVLIPGAGMGRLAHEIVRRGYVVEGNEFNLCMLFASNFVLNKCNGKDTFSCFPWIHQTTNVLDHMDQVRSVTFPDIDPTDMPKDTRFSMTAGDFLDVYSGPANKGSWDCVVTCFFIDCANNIVAFLERIYECLKDGGTWINLGPLLYHYSDMVEEESIEPSFDFLIDIIRKVGFLVEKQLVNVTTQYAENHLSMLKYSYKSVFLVCRKMNLKILSNNSRWLPESYSSLVDDKKKLEKSASCSKASD